MNYKMDICRYDMQLKICIELRLKGFINIFKAKLPFIRNLTRIVRNKYMVTIIKSLLTKNISSIYHNHNTINCFAYISYSKVIRVIRENFILLTYNESF